MPLTSRAPFGGRSFGNRAFSSTSSAAGAAVHATITDHREIDRALLAEAARREGKTHDILGRPVSTAPPVPRGVAEGRSSLAPSVDSLWRPRR